MMICEPIHNAGAGLTARVRAPCRKRRAVRISALAATLVLAAAAAAASPAGDFDGDGKADLLQRNLHSDAWRFHTLVDDVPEEHALAIDTDPVWRFVASGDFDGNGYDDVLVRRYDTRRIAYHAVTATGVQFRQLTGVTNKPLYDFLGAGDFDGDGKDEVLIRRNRDFGIWFYYDIDGTRATLRRNTFRATQNLDFEFAAIGDLDGDGRDDILARHREKKYWVAYLMNGYQPAQLRRPRITQNPLFVLQAFADLTGDGKADPVLRSTASGEWIYYATGDRVGTGRRVTMRLHRGLGMTRNRHWVLAAIGDFDGDGRASPILRHRLYGGWVMYDDIEGATSDLVRFPGLSTQRVWVAVGRLSQDNVASFSRVEFLQGPPTFRKDFATGQTIGPIPASRPENGAEPVPVWEPIVGRTGQQAWSADNKGFVASVWGREMIVAVEATHTYRAPAPQLEVELLPAEGEAVTLDVLQDVTEPRAGGYRTEMVFDLPRERNVPGGTVVVRLRTGETTLEERQALFGETVEPVRVTWIPISTEDFAAPELDAEDYFSTIRNAWPIGDYATGVGPEMRYATTGNELPNTVMDADGEGGLVDQVVHHHATHGCGVAEDYYAIYPNTAMSDARVDTGGIAIGGLVMIGGDFPRPIFGIERHESGEYPHEAGHQWGVRHTACGGAPGPDPDYPYANAALGPARSWSFLGGFFVEPDDGFHDVMSYCDPSVASDFTYLKMTMYFQGSERVEEAAQWEQCAVDGGVEPVSMAVSGIVRHDGSVAITGTSASTQPPWGAPPDADAEFWLTTEDAQGAHHREPLVLTEMGPHRPQVRAVWSARVPLPADPDGVRVSVQHATGDVLSETVFQRAR